MATRRPPARRTTRAAQVRAKRVYPVRAGQGQRESNNRRSRRRPRHTHVVVGAGLILLAAVVGGMHFAEHADYLQLMNPHLQDLLLGYPTTGVLGMAGFVALIWR
jgi:hypothetical protein